jgi:methyl-accepting chemotaxis protein
MKERRVTMKLKQKILSISIIPLILSSLLIGYTILQMKSLNSSTEEIVSLLVDVESLNGSINSTRKSLSAYSLNMTDSNAHDVIQDLNDTKSVYEKLAGSLTQKEYANLNDRISFKFTELYDVAIKAVESKNRAEVKRQSLRTKGVANDIYELKAAINEQYKTMQRQMQEKIASIVQFSTLAVLALVIGSIVFASIFTKRIVSPIQKITENAQHIANGDLSVSHLHIRTKDEVFELNESFSRMTEQLRSLIEKVGSESTQVAASAEQLSASAEESMKGLEVVTDSIQQISSGSDNQTEMTAEASRAMGETARGMNRIAESVSLVSDLALQTNTRAEHGTKLVQEVVTQMTSISQSVQETDTNVSALNERSKEIGSILKLITDIADQTNLLSLNAAIEAARAGEAGKGFAVVAAEVRKLAEQTAQSVSQISSIIQEVQKGTEESTHSMNTVKDQVSIGLKMTNETASTFQEILQSMVHVGTQIDEISATSQQMSAGSQQVAASIHEMAMVAKQTSDRTQEVASGSEQQLASMEEVNSASMSLTKIAEELQAIIAKFKL